MAEVGRWVPENEAWSVEVPASALSSGTVSEPVVTHAAKLQALVHDILSPTTAIADYAIGLEKLSAKEQFIDDAQTARSL